MSENLKDIEKVALQAMREMRLLLYQLREETHDQELTTALDIRFRQVENRLGIKALHEIDTNIFMPDEVRHHIWRILIETLNNSVKHASANHVSVKIDQMSSNIHVNIQDDGVGFDVTNPYPGMGLKNIKARVKEMGGECKIISQPGEGTQIILQIPFDDTHSQRRR